MKQDNNIREIFERYLSGNTTAAEEQLLFRYIRESDPENNDLNGMFEKVWNEQKPSLNESEEVKAEFAEIMKRVSVGENKRKAPLYMGILKYAASVAIICSAAWMLFQHKHKAPHQEETAVIAMEGKTTAEGQKVKIVLKDSTVVYLAGGSSLKWPETFKKGETRDVYLEGEAFFEVRKDSLSPFIVHSGKLRTRVLGTSFNIYAYSNDNQFTVSVRSGKVQVSDLSNEQTPRQLSLLTAGMKLSYSNADGKYAVSTDNPTEDTNAWVVNRFVFADANLKEVLERLERYYNVKFEYKSTCPNAGHMFNATFENMNISEVMEQLQLMSGGNIQYKMNKNKSITLWRKDCR
ncbi:FecR family protein [Sphingobacterium hotanense]|uniref:FecR family protein n=1 Tax=Sphingobacterium TaxID=28453 RepID=UPI0021A4C7AA|nr:FecR family protein [Sphingobacterium hotanense]MCT1523676.1 FecR domain-containing protein [Sphingobacterium hotanense]